MADCSLSSLTLRPPARAPLNITLSPASDRRCNRFQPNSLPREHDPITEDYATPELRTLPSAETGFVWPAYVGRWGSGILRAMLIAGRSMSKYITHAPTTLASTPNPKARYATAVE